MGAGEIQVYQSVPRGFWVIFTLIKSDNGGGKVKK